MQQGKVLAGRFELEGVAGVGGVGSVYRARDRETDDPVAVKILRVAGPDNDHRFAREVRALSELVHPAIVRFVAQGVTADGRPFVAMEWVEGETLEKRLKRGPLPLADALILTRRVAEGLAVAHARGIIHRDINPTNIILRRGLVEEAKIVDFGLVRLAEPVVTLSGALLGTPGFMAPEQVRGLPDIDARADVFALGCVLFKALTGKPPFDGDVMACLAKVLFDSTPRVRRIRPDVPWDIDQLVAAMMAHDREERPRDGGEVLDELGGLPTERRMPSATPAGGVLTIDEQRFVSVVMAVGVHDPVQNATVERARAAAAPFGARVELLADGTLVAALSSKGSARDQAKQATRCALALRDVIEDDRLALATGRAAIGAAGIMGEVIERATSLLRSPGSALSPTSKRQRPIAIDPTTASLLDTQFDVVGDGAQLGLRRERPTAAEANRTLLGRPTPFVGREREMGTVEAVFRECTSEGVAHAVLVTGPSGAGKSRLRHEFVKRVRGNEEPREVWIARGDPMSAGSPLGMIAQIIRSTAGILEGETLRTRQAKLTARVSRHVPAADLARVTEFLGEIASIRISDTASVQLHAARRSALLMGDQMRRAWEDFARAECSAQPVLLVLEDLHWGDLPTVTFLDTTLRNLRDRPFMILALAQPNVHQLFPELWAAHPMTELHLGELSRRAAERLARQVLGGDASEETVSRIVEQAAGNAFYLEELIRSVAEGREELPPTVLAMVQARLSSLDVGARRVLRAASLFGSTFWKAGVASLVDQTEHSLDIAAHLEELVRREFITPRELGRFPDEYVFRHSIVRSAAYDMLTSEDRSLGHRLAGAWLERAGESDAMVLAEQFERGSEPERAIACYQRAATQALEGNDLGAALSRAAKAMACGARGERLGDLLVIQAEAHRWRGELAEVESSLLRALGVLPRGTARWYDAASELISTRVRLARHEGLEALVSDLCDDDIGADVGVSRATAWARAAVPLAYGGFGELAAKLFELIERAALDLQDPSVLARVHQACAAQALASGDLYLYLEHTEATVTAFEIAGDFRNACLQRSNAGYARTTLGAYGDAEATLRDALTRAEHLGLPAVAAVVRQYLGLTLTHRGALHEARVVQEQAILATAASGETLMLAWSRVYLAELLLVGGNVEAAERAARAALAGGAGAANEVRMHALATLSAVLIKSGRVGEALDASSEGMDLLARIGGFSGEAIVRLRRAEALRASGDRGGAREVIRDARDRLRARAEKISDTSLRQSFLENVAANARTLSLASEWLANGETAAT